MTKAKMKYHVITAIYMELAGLLLVAGGIGIELTAHAHIGYVLITCGSLALAAGGFIWGKVLRQK